LAFSEPKGADAKDASVEDPSKLAERIPDQDADAVIATDRSRALTRCNRASAALFGFSAAVALDQSVDLIIPAHLRAPHWSGFDAAMAKGATRLLGPSDTSPRAPKERTPALGRDELCACLRRRRPRRAWRGRSGRRRHRAGRAGARCKVGIASGRLQSVPSAVK